MISPEQSGIKLPTHLREMTDDEFFYFCQENAEFTFERDADGTITTMALTGGKTGKRNTELITDLNIWNRITKKGLAFDSSTGFRLPNGATRSPDIAWISLDKWNNLSDEQQSKFPPVCPEFLAELMSDSDSLTQAKQKMDEYIENGCQLAWLIEPRTETVRIYRADGSVSIVQGFDNKLSSESILPGFSFDLLLLR
jgi:Uma2 family endonuclease